MSKFYKIIIDENELDRFIEMLPDTEGEQKYYVALFARNKYGATEGLKADKQQLKRFLASKDQIKNKIKKLEIRKGEYKYNDIEINENSLALYINPCPRDMKKANLLLMEMILKGIKTDTYKNPTSLALNAAQVSFVHEHKVMDFDLDFHDKESNYTVEIINYMDSIMNSNAYMLIRTHGGVHISVRPKLIEEKYRKYWYNNISFLNKHIKTDIMNNGDGLIPMPGTRQSNKSPKIIKSYE